MDTDVSVLCADIGTTSLKTALINSSGTVLCFSQQFFDPDIPSAAAGQWLRALCRAAAEFGSRMRHVCAVCISGNGPTIVSEDGTTLLWNAEIPKTVPPHIATSGTDAGRISTSHSLFIPRILAFKHIFPDVWNSEQTVFSGPEYLIWQLCGTAVTILPEIRYTGAYWTPEELAAEGIPAGKLPRFVPSTYNAGLTQCSINTVLGLTQSVPVICGAPDFIAALVGTNTLKNGMICDCAGSSEGLNLCTVRPVEGSGIRTLPSVIPELWNAGVLFIASGRKFADYKIQTEKERGISISYGAFIAECVNDTSSHGYKLMYSLAGEVRGGLEILLKTAEKARIQVSPYIAATGGQAKSALWLQMKADIIGYPIAVTSCPDAELIGDAVFAWTALGQFSSIKEAADHLVTGLTVYRPRS